MEFTPELLAKVSGMGMFGYDVYKIINILDVDDSEHFISEFLNSDSELKKAYQKGLDKSDYIVDNKLYELVKEGNIEAIKIFEERKLQRKCISIND